MKRLLIVCSLVWLSCEEVPPDVLYGEPFELAYGESALVGEKAIEVGFQSVITDFRCPIGVICNWEGIAAIQLYLLHVDRDSVFLPASTGRYLSYRNPKDTLGYRITLVQLNPYPEWNKPIVPAEYEVILTLEML